MQKYIVRRFKEGDLEISDQGRRFSWSWYDIQEPNVGNEDSTSLKTTFDALNMYCLNRALSIGK